MSIPTSGTISFNTVKNELGVSSSSFSLKSAELGNYVAINRCSTYRPNEEAYFQLSEWYGYNHSQACATPPVYPRRLENVTSFIETNDGKVIATGKNIQYTALGVTYFRQGMFKFDSNFLGHDLGFNGISSGGGPSGPFYNGAEIGGIINQTIEEQSGLLVSVGYFQNFNNITSQEFWSVVKTTQLGYVSPYEYFNYNNANGINNVTTQWSGFSYQIIRSPAPAYAIHKSTSTGKITIGGTFNHVGYTSCENVCRLTADGAIDYTFSNNCRLSTKVSQGSVKIVNFAKSNQGFYIIGTFSSQVNGDTGPIFHNIIRVNEDGTTDFGFNPNGGSFVDTSEILIARSFPEQNVYHSYEEANLSAIKVRSDSIVVVGGKFLKYLRGASVVGTPHYIVALNTDGTIANTFNGGLNGEVYCMDILSDNSLIVGGIFINYNITSSTGYVKGIIKYNSDYTEDTTFNQNLGRGPERTNPTNQVAIRVIKILSSGKILVYGTFDSWNGNTNMQNIALLNNDGTLAWS